ncbi:DUF4199 domain-containing protein [Erythrobacter sp. YT30]|uniref:DUF4199 domain-containing protein n=1 Tax=Erythrobacter sp. YT30 TaxID=1735012 RepID=UPI00076CB5FD|nr:DUF4199 domain-containing protein [Erythrobacter sp. YT30]KWV92635.1 hypothetical protein AUC45_00170 [Erythrobacter sp. YT30]
MLRYSLTFGGIIGVLVIALMTVTLFALGPDAGGTTELLGYVTMLAILSLLFMGIKRYRDLEQGGVITFKQGALVGTGIAVIAALIYTISWEGVLVATDYAFIETYSQSQIDAIKAEGLPAAQEAEKIAEVQAGMEQYRNPLFRLPITFIEIFPVGLVVALLSAAILRFPKVLPARANAASAA